MYRGEITEAMIKKFGYKNVMEVPKFAQRKQELASHLNKQDYLDDAAMNMAEVMGTTGMYKEALEQLGQIDKKTLSDYLYLLLVLRRKAP